MNAANPLALLASLVLFLYSANSFAAEESKSETDLFQDNNISFAVPKGSKVERLEDKRTYLVFNDREMFFLKLRGPEEVDDFGRRRAEVSRDEIASKKGVPTKDDDATVTVTSVSELKREPFGDGSVYLFTFSATSEGESGTGYTTIGFGSIQKTAIWVQHTSTTEANHAEQVIQFIKSIIVEKADSAEAKP